MCYNGDMKTIERTVPENEAFPLRAGDFSARTAVLDIESTGRYWRNSRIERLCLVMPDRQDPPVWRAVERIFLPDTEPEEYEMLQQLPELLNPDAADGELLFLLTYNGTTFDLPYLRNKLRAYGLPDPFDGILHRDLMREMGALPLLLQLPSRRLQDFREYLGQPDADDACVTWNLIALEPYLGFFRTLPEMLQCSRDETHLYFTLKLPSPVPKKASMNDGPFHLILERGQASVSAKAEDGMLRYYYPDFGNYVYLPEEKCAVHKSMASLIDRSRRQKAVRENCFTKVRFDDAFMANEKRLREYLSAVWTYLKTPFV